MTAPPRITAWLLESSLAASDRDAVMGDLYEEFSTYIIPQRGVTMARWWYRVQVARSLMPLYRRSWERASLGRATLAVTGAALVVTTPTTLLVLLRSFVLQQVPLKTTAEASIEFALLLLVAALASGALGVATALRVLNAKTRER
jgi:hypothetical protein